MSTSRVKVTTTTRPITNAEQSQAQKKKEDGAKVRSLSDIIDPLADKQCRLSRNTDSWRRRGRRGRRSSNRL